MTARTSVMIVLVHRDVVRLDVERVLRRAEPRLVVVEDRLEPRRVLVHRRQVLARRRDFAAPRREAQVPRRPRHRARLDRGRGGARDLEHDGDARRVVVGAGAARVGVAVGAEEDVLRAVLAGQRRHDRLGRVVRRSSPRARTRRAPSRRPSASRAAASPPAATRRTRESSTFRAAGRRPASPTPTPGRRTAPPRTRRSSPASDCFETRQTAPGAASIDSALALAGRRPRTGPRRLQHESRAAGASAGVANLPRHRLVPVARRVLAHRHLESGLAERARPATRPPRDSTACRTCACRSRPGGERSRPSASRRPWRPAPARP